MAIFLSGILLLVIIGVGCNFLGVIVPEGGTGIRLRSGVPTDQKIEQGVYLNIPGLYEIKTFKGGIHISPMNVNVRHQDGQGIRVLWRVIDGRRFHKLRQASASDTEEAIGVALIKVEIQNAILPSDAKKPNPDKSKLFSSTDWDYLVEKLNGKIVGRDGIKILRIDQDISQNP